MESLFSCLGSGEILALVSSISYSFTLISLRKTLRSITPLTAVLLFNGMVSATGLIAASIGGTLQTSSLPFVLWFALGGITGRGLGQLVFFMGIERMGVSRATPIAASAPLWAVLFAIAVLGERPGAAVWLGTLGIVAGVFLLSMSGDKGDGTGNWLQGALIFPLAASVLYAITPVCAKLAYAHQRAPLAGMGIAYAVGTLVLLAGRPLLPDRGELRLDRQALRWLLPGGVCHVISSAAMMTAFNVGDVSVVMPISRITPLWVLILGYFLLRRIERITSRVLVGAVLVVAGGILVTAFRG